MSDDRRVIVIGSGPAGAMAAHELIRKGIPVTMLESSLNFENGLLVRMMGRNLYRRVPTLETGKRHTSSGDPNTDWYCSLLPGGLSNQWTGAVPRFAPEDFTEGERLHEKYCWPVTYAEMSPYYELCEKLLDITADSTDHPNMPAGYAAHQHKLPKDWQHVAKYAALRGQTLTTLPLADGPPWMFVRRGTAFNSYTNIVSKLLKSPHFEIKFGAHALQLEWSGEKKRADAVVYHDRSNGKEHRLPAAAIVIACGALNSTKLLFNSACSDFPEGMGNTAGLLGKYLHDHPREWWVFDVERPISLLAPSAYLTRIPHAESEPLIGSSWTLGVVSIKDKVMSRFAFKGKSISVQVFGTMIPTENQLVKLADEKKDEFGQPLLDICIRYTEQEVNNMIQSRERLISIMNEAGYKSTIREVAPQLRPGSSVHYGGSARMHSSPKYGVVDSWNRLYDVQNVLVCDSSCFTTAGEKNPVLTSMAIAARAAERLSEDLKKR